MMSKLALLVVFFAVVVGLISMLIRAVEHISAHQSNRLGGRGDTMQRLTFFLLLALIAYVAASGAS